MDAEDARRARAAGRANWPGTTHALAVERDEDLSATTTALERIAMVWRMPQDAWAMSGKPIPDYPRNESPGRLVRRDERRETLLASKRATGRAKDLVDVAALEKAKAGE